MDSLQQSITTSQGELRQELEATKKALMTEQEAGLSKDSELSNHQNMVLRLRREIDEERNERYKMAALLESTETAKTALENKVRQTMSCNIINDCFVYVALHVRVHVVLIYMYSTLYVYCIHMYSTCACANFIHVHCTCICMY